MTSPISTIRSLGGIMERAAFALKAGITFGGKRDLYEALGYKRVLMPLDYRARYERGGIAARIVEAYPFATWLGTGDLEEDEDPDTETEFETAWDELNTRLNVWSMFRRADILAGIGQYSIMMIGAPGDVEKELPKMKGPEDILFLAPYGQDETTILEVEGDIENERFGLPTLYRVRRRTMTPSGARVTPIFDRQVHWTRILHVADLSLDDRVFGHSRLERVWNNLDDLDKVTGGGSESFWLRAHQGHFYKFDPEAKIDKDEIQKMKDEAELFAHGMKRTMAMRGAEIQALGSDVANFASPITALISLISGASGIPQRLLLGSERGELASTQDKENWNDRVQGRRQDFAEPTIIRPFVERLIKCGALPEPETWRPRWPEIEELNEAEKGQVAFTWAGLNKTSGGVVVLPAEIRDHILGLKPLTPKQIADATPEPPVIVAPDGTPGGKPVGGGKPAGAPATKPGFGKPGFGKPVSKKPDQKIPKKQARAAGEYDPA